MTDLNTAPVPEPAESGATVGRRTWFRRGAMLAGAAAGAAVVLRPDAAAAADGDNLLLGADNEATSSTTLSIGEEAGSAQPALALQNADGPALAMNPLSATWAGQLQVGEMAGTDLGPIVGVDAPDGPTTTYLVTGVDLANLATPFVGSPQRALDLRTEAGRSAVIRRSTSSALTADGKLRAGQWIDVALAFTGSDYVLEAIFANLTVTGAITSGYATVYPPGVRPKASSLNFAAKTSLANAAFVGTGEVFGQHAVRLHSTADAWFILDVSGGLIRGNVAAPLGQAGRAKGGRTALVTKVRGAIARRLG